MRNFLVIVFACLVLFGPAAAQKFVPGVFDSYEDLSDAMDGAMMRADVASALMRFDGGRTTEGEALDVQRKFNQLFPNGFTHKAVLRKEVYSDGFWRELRAYWNEQRYLWVSILVHDRGDRVVAIEFTTNTDYDTVAGQF